jgi:MoCo/4Fe-4S cofactor protein with predicted Tat translocation signal
LDNHHFYKMKDHTNDLWVGSAQLENGTAFEELSKQEFFELPIAEQLADQNKMEDLSANRRDFLKYLGFGLGAATIASSCDIPLKKAIPYVTKPDEIVPGVATYYASSFVDGGDYCAILVKTREGRPIKVEGNTLSSITKGGTNARAQASVLSLYDTNRIDGPYRISGGKLDRPQGKFGKGPSLAEIDKEIGGKLKPSSRIALVTPTIMSPMTKQAIADFTAKFAQTTVYTYDAISSAAILDANQKAFGQAVIPSYMFDKAEVIVSFEADFLGTWISPVEFAGQYVKNRVIKDTKKAKMSRHIQVESHMSLTGSNADNRILVKPSEQGAAIVALYNEVAALTGGSKVSGPALDAEKAAKIKGAAKDLAAAKGKALVVSASNNTAEQVLINGINAMLDSYGNTITFANHSNQRQGMEREVIRTLTGKMNAGQVDAVIFFNGVNPAWDLPNADAFASALGKVKTKISLTALPNETMLLCDYVVPTNHFLESWGDVEPKKGHYSIIQPTIAPLFDTRQTEETLLTWADSDKLNKASEHPMYDFLQSVWQTQVFPQQSRFATFQSFWDSTLHDGVFENPVASFTEFGWGADAAAEAKKVRKPASGGMEISFFETVNMGDGRFANNPWLQELPDPVSRTSWGNYLAIPVKYEGGIRFKALNDLNEREIYGTADFVEVSAKGKTEKVTAVRQFGQMWDTISLAIGYGRNYTGNQGRAIGDKIGVNVYPMMSVDSDGNVQYYATDAKVSESVGKEKDFACVQYHHGMGLSAKENGKTITDPSSGEPLNIDEKASMTLGAGYQGGIVNRSIIYKGNISELGEMTEHIAEKRAEAQKLNQQTLYPFDKYTANNYSQAHWWAMHVDLNACIGCGACQIACTAENNVPVVGKYEVSRHHEMTWLRIDRYFFGDYETPNVVYQPMMCQHCDNAPCENVCPVAATNHSSEGLNQMTYNRCIGTRYCANNCPYKVRRFNWLDYTTADMFPINENRLANEELPFTADNLMRMVLNPDVTVRSRGVIEKCSFCVQRIQEGKLTAKREGRKLKDNDVKTACQTACPTGAIVFGDRNDKSSALGQRWESPLNYLALEEINVQSSVMYSAKVVNRNESLDA